VGVPNDSKHFFFPLSFFMFPFLKIWKFPHPLAFAHALVYCQMCSFMLGYHVHEKAILMAIVPVGMLAADSVDDAKVYLLMSWVGHISLFPLLEERREVPTKILFTSIHMLLSYVSLDRYHRSEQRAIHIEQSRRGIRFNSLEHLYLCGLGVLLLFVEFIHPIFFVKYNADNEKIVMMPFLPLLMMSIYCASGLIYTWYLSYKQYVSKIKRIMSYAESPWLKPEQPETLPPSLVL
jgi:alpha-1,3-glucosyltransferase